MDDMLGCQKEHAFSHPWLEIYILAWANQLAPAAFSNGNPIHWQCLYFPILMPGGFPSEEKSWGAAANLSWFHERRHELAPKLERNRPLRDALSGAPTHLAIIFREPSKKAIPHIEIRNSLGAQPSGVLWSPPLSTRRTSWRRAAWTRDPSWVIFQKPITRLAQK